MPDALSWNYEGDGACATCGGRGWCLACEGTQHMSCWPDVVECTCRYGYCGDCNGYGWAGGELRREHVCPTCGCDAIVDHRDATTTVGCPRCRTTDSMSIHDRRHRTWAWRRVEHHRDGPGEFRCPNCGSDEVIEGRLERSVAEGWGANVACWRCGQAENDPDGRAVLARWRNPAYRAWAATQAARAVFLGDRKRARGLADRAELAMTWPWQPRSRRTPAERRAIAVASWLDEVLRAPDDTYVRLVVADVIERDDPERAQFVRSQVDGERVLGRVRNERDVANALAGPPTLPAWSSELAALARDRIVADAVVVRGFVEHVTMRAADFLAHGDEVWERAPIRFLTLTHVGGQAAAIAASPLLARVRGLRLPGYIERPAHDRGRRETWAVNTIGDADIRAFAGSPHLGELVVLDVSQSREIAPAAWAALAAAAPGLRRVVGAPTRRDARGRAIADACGGDARWLPPARTVLTGWQAMRALCAGAPLDVAADDDAEP